MSTPLLSISAMYALFILLLQPLCCILYVNTLCLVLSLEVEENCISLSFVERKKVHATSWKKHYMMLIVYTRHNVLPRCSCFNVGHSSPQQWTHSLGVHILISSTCRCRFDEISKTAAKKYVWLVIFIVCLLQLVHAH